MPSWGTVDGDDVLLGFRVTIENNIEDELLEMTQDIREWQTRYLEEVAREIAETAKDIVGVESGVLRDSIYYVDVSDNPQWAGDAAAADRTEFKIGTNKYYGRFQEFGYRHSSGSWVPANSFLRAALYSVSSRIDRQAVNDALRRFLRSRQGGGGGGGGSPSSPVRPRPTPSAPASRSAAPRPPRPRPRAQAPVRPNPSPRPEPPRTPTPRTPAPAPAPAPQSPNAFGVQKRATGEYSALGAMGQVIGWYATEAEARAAADRNRAMWEHHQRFNP